MTKHAAANIDDKTSLIDRIMEFRTASAIYEAKDEKSSEAKRALARRYQLWDSVLYGKPHSLEELVAQARLIWDDRCQHEEALLNLPEVAAFLRSLPEVLLGILNDARNEEVLKRLDVRPWKPSRARKRISSKPARKAGGAVARAREASKALRGRTGIAAANRAFALARRSRKSKHSK